jgi:hypothetical protein
MAEVLKTTADLMAAREAATRLAGEFGAIQARPWWRRLVGYSRWPSTQSSPRPLESGITTSTHLILTRLFVCSGSMCVSRGTVAYVSSPIARGHRSRSLLCRPPLRIRSPPARGSIGTGSQARPAAFRGLWPRPSGWLAQAYGRRRLLLDCARRRRWGRPWRVQRRQLRQRFGRWQGADPGWTAGR